MIIIPKICGTCSGSNNAIEKSIQATQLYPTKKIVIYKEILHNKRVIEDLAKKNIFCVDNLDTVNENNVVIIRAHGEGKNTYDYLNNKNISIVDATCPNVLRVHEIIKEKYDLGYSIIIIGKKIDDKHYHPEVEGSNGWCNNEAIIIDSTEDLNNIKNLNNDILIICQTTANENKVLEYKQLIEKKYANKNVEFVNTICNAQKLIQKSSIEVAKKVNIMFVIGGKNSSNTHELFEKCNEHCKCIKVSSKDELIESLKNSNITNQTIIGITGGASTPQYEIEEYKKIIEDYQNNK